MRPIEKARYEPSTIPTAQPTTPPYGPPPGYGPPAGYPAPYAPPGYGAAPYPPAYGAAHPPAYGAMPWNAPRPSTVWPYGPDRPGIATAAAVMGFVTGGLTALGGLIALISVLLADADLPTGLLALGLPCAAGLIRGGVSLLNRDSERVLVASAVLSVVVLVFALVAGVIGYSGDDVVGLLVFVVLAGSLPVVTGALAVSRTVKGWLSSLA